MTEKIKGSVQVDVEANSFEGFSVTLFGKGLTIEEVASAFYQLGARDVFDAPYRGVVDQLSSEQCEENRSAVLGFGKGYTIGGVNIDRVRKEFMPHLWGDDPREETRR